MLNIKVIFPFGSETTSARKASGQDAFVPREITGQWWMTNFNDLKPPVYPALRIVLCWVLEQIPGCLEEKAELNVHEHFLHSCTFSLWIGVQLAVWKVRMAWESNPRPPCCAVAALTTALLCHLFHYKERQATWTSLCSVTQTDVTSLWHFQSVTPDIWYNFLHKLGQSEGLLSTATVTKGLARS